MGWRMMNRRFYGEAACHDYEQEKGLVELDERLGMQTRIAYSNREKNKLNIANGKGVDIVEFSIPRFSTAVVSI